MKLTIEMDNVVEFTRAGVTMEVDVSTLPKGIVANLITHGLTQKVGDAAAGAVGKAAGDDWDKMNADERKAWKADNEKAIAKVAADDMNAVLKQLAEGNWGVQRTGATLSELDKEILKVVREQIKGHDKYKALEAEGRTGLVRQVVDEMADKQREAVTAFAQSRIDERKAQAKAAAEIGVSL